MGALDRAALIASVLVGIRILDCLLGEQFVSLRGGPTCPFKAP